MNWKWLVILLALPSILCAMPTTQPDYSLAVQDYIKLGAPSPSKTWNAKDMSAAARVLKDIASKDPTKLPRLRSASSGEMFKRLASLDNLRPLVKPDPSTPIEERVKANRLFMAEMDFLSAYIKHFPDFPDEVAELSCNVMIGLQSFLQTDDFADALVKDFPGRTRLEATHARTRRAFGSTVYQISWVMGNPEVSKEERSKLVSAMMQNAPKIVGRLDPDWQKRIISMCRYQMHRETDSQIKERISSLVDKIVAASGESADSEKAGAAQDSKLELPSPDKIWSADDLSTAAQLLKSIASKDPALLPCLRNPASREMFKGFASVYNLHSLMKADPSTPIEERLAENEGLFKAETELLIVYMEHFTDFPDEVAKLSCNVMIALHSLLQTDDDFADALPRDYVGRDNFEAVCAAKRPDFGTIVYRIAWVMGHQQISKEERTKLVLTVTDNMPKVVGRLDSYWQKRVINMCRDDMDKETDSQIKKRISSLVDKLVAASGESTTRKSSSQKSDKPSAPG